MTFSEIEQLAAELLLQVLCPDVEVLILSTAARV